MTDQPSCLLIGIAGPSGSGKSFLADRLLQALPDQHGAILSQDHYYRERSDLPLAERQNINYDHPEALEFSLLHTHLQQLRHGQRIVHPLYDFSQHNRRPETAPLAPPDYIIVDGILLFAMPELLPLFDLKIYVDTPMDICFIRRLRRDVEERGRTVDSVVQQYLQTVRPMFLQFVAPSRESADLVVAGEGSMGHAVHHITAQLQPLFSQLKK